jgi:2-methylisocitrate lyase-like PEP mutase family enzyme
MYKTVCDAVGVPVLANITEFGDTPYYTKEQLAEQGISMVLYPLSPIICNGFSTSSACLNLKPADFCSVIVLSLKRYE